MNRTGDIKLIIIQNKEILKQLDQNTLEVYQRYNMKYGALFGAPTVIFVAVKKLEGKFRDGHFCSAACIVENMCLAATEMRLGNLFMTGVTSALNENPVLSEAIGITKDYEAVAAMAVGKTDLEWVERDLEKEKFNTLRILDEK